MREILLLTAAFAAIPLAAAAQPPAAAMTPEQVVAARRTAMFLSGGSLAAMKSAADGGGDLKLLVPGARGLERWAGILPGMFPAGTDVGPTAARPDVWSDRAGFEAAAAAYGRAAGQLAAAADAGDRAAFQARWTEVRGTCGACHDNYKS